MLKSKIGKISLICFLFIVIAIIASLMYTQWEYRNIKTTLVDLKATKSGLSGIKIVFAADFQYDMYSRQPESIESETFQKAIDLIMAQDADLILLGGDYQTYSTNTEDIAPYLKQLHAPLGVFGVFGNHDSLSSEELVSLLPNIEFLENESVTLTYNNTDFTVYGVDDLWKGNPAVEWSDVDPEKYNILLTHNPDFVEYMPSEKRDNFNLALAGHTHAGQVTFFGLRGFSIAMDRASKFGEKYRYGEKEYDGFRTYVTSGLGGAVFHVPIRFGASPEIVVLS